MGPLKLFSAYGSLTAQITAENTQVRDIINKGLENLRQNLLDQGVNVNKLVVNVQESNTSNNNNLQQDQSFQKFEQATNQSFSNPNSHSSRQASDQAKSNDFIGKENIDYEEDMEQNLASKQSSNTVTQGRIDYRV